MPWVQVLSPLAHDGSAQLHPREEADPIASRRLHGGTAIWLAPDWR